MTGGIAISFSDDSDSNRTSRWAGVARIKGPPWLQLPAITIGLLGVQIFWSVEMSYASPYLLSLGLSKSLMALVFIAGPLSGLIMQPLIGILADNSKSRFGRRRPYMLGGCILCIFAMLLLGYTRSFADTFTSAKSHANNILTIWLAVLAIYFIDFSINAVQAVDRAILVDTLPASEQANGNAWAARMLGIGSVVGFLFGAIDLPHIFPIFGDTELEVLAAIASLFLLFTHILTAGSVEERVLLSSSGSRKSFFREIKEMVQQVRTLPRVIRQICFIQFFAWIGWFPFIFYTTTYIGDIHKANSPPPTSEEARILLDDEATRLGSRAMLYNAILSMIVNILLPFFVAESRSTSPITPKSPAPGFFQRIQVHLCSLWAASHLVFAVCMLSTLFVSTVAGSTLVMTIVGFSWAITQWAPFSLLAEAILTESSPGEDPGSILLEDSRSRRGPNGAFPSQDEDERQYLVIGEDEDEDENDSRHSGEQANHSNIMGNPNARRSLLHVSTSNGNGLENEDEEMQKGPSRGGLSAKAGIILGIHNVFLVLPQFIVTGISSIIFAIVDPGKSALRGHAGSGQMNSTTVSNTLANATDAMMLYLRQDDEIVEDTGPNAVGIVFRLGGISTAVAFALCWRLARELKQR